MRLNALFMIAAMFGSAAAMAADEGPRYIVHDRSAERGPLPFSEAVIVGDAVYVSGHIGIDPKTDQAAKDPEVEAKLVMDAIEQTVKSSGLTMDDLVSVTVYCTDLHLYDTFNTVYKSYFHAKYPARAFIGVAQLLRGAHFEVQGIAVRTRAQHKQ
jgi:2-iminobutanoate/2-iminopropanoate deaminase